MVDHKNKLIFIHIPRTGGHAVYDAFGIKTPVKGMHMTAFEIHKSIGDDVWYNYTTFSIVRHPLERFMSNTLWKPVFFRGMDNYFFDYTDTTPWGKRTPPVYNNQPMYKYLDEPVDYILKHETLQSDMNEMLDDIGMPPVEIPVHDNNTTVNMINYYDARLAFELDKYPHLKKEMEIYGYDYKY